MIVKKWIYLKKNTLHRGFSSSSVGKKSACNAGGSGSIPGLERSPVEGIDYPLQYSCLQNPHGQRSLAGYSPRDHGKESDMAEQLSTAQNTIIISFFPEYKPSMGIVVGNNCLVYSGEENGTKTGKLSLDTLLNCLNLLAEFI